MRCTLTINPALDLTYDTETLVPDDINRASVFRQNAGGKGINVSRALNILGIKSRAMGFIGGYPGAYIKSTLKELEIVTGFIEISGQTRINITLNNIRPHEIYKVNAPGPRITSGEKTAMLDKIKGLPESTEIFAISGSLLPGLPTGFYTEIIRILKKKRIFCILDTDGDPLKRSLPACPDMIKPNLYELERLTGKNIRNEGDIVKNARKLVESGIKLVVVSCGQEGLYSFTDGECYRADPPRVKIDSTIGAGDSVVAAFCAGLPIQEPLKDITRLAAACGAAAVMTPATDLFRMEDVNRILSEVKIQRIN